MQNNNTNKMQNKSNDIAELSDVTNNNNTVRHGAFTHVGNGPVNADSAANVLSVVKDNEYNDSIISAFIKLCDIIDGHLAIEPQGSLSGKDIDKMIFNAKVNLKLAGSKINKGLGGRSADRKLRNVNNHNRAVSHSKSKNNTQIRKSSLLDHGIKEAQSAKQFEKLMIEPQGRISDILGDIKLELGPASANLFDELNSTLQGLTNRGINMNHDLVKTNFENAASLLGSNSTTVSVAMFIFLLFFGFRLKNGDKSDKIWFSIVLGMLTLLNVNKAKVLDCVKQLVKYFEDEAAPIVPHSYQDILVNSVIGYIYYSYFDGLKGDYVANFFQKTSNMKKTRDGLEFTFSFVIKRIQEFLDFITDKLSLKKVTIDLTDMPEIVLYAERVSTLMKKFIEGKTMNHASYNEVWKLYEDGKKLSRSISNSKEFDDARRLLSTTMAELHPLILKLKRSNISNNGPRIEPLGVFFTGPSAIGKSTAAFPIMLGVTALVLDENKLEDFRSNTNDFIYNRVKETEYWDGYTGQFNCLFDDLGQVKDVPGGDDNVYMETIRCINSNNFDLHMAHLDDKGNNNFTSRLVWATSNNTSFRNRLHSINDSEAFTRRWKCSFLVVPKKGCRLDELETDPWKIRLAPNVDFSEFKHIEYFKYDILNGKILDETPYSVKDVIGLVADQYKHMERVGTKILASHESWKDEYIKVRHCGMETRGDISSLGYSPICDSKRTFDSFNITGLEPIGPQANDALGPWIVNDDDATVTELAAIWDVTEEEIVCAVHSIQVPTTIEELRMIVCDKPVGYSFYDRSKKALLTYQNTMAVCCNFVEEQMVAAWSKYKKFFFIAAGLSAALSVTGVLLRMYRSAMAVVEQSPGGVRKVVNVPRTRIREREGFKFTRNRNAGRGHQQLRGERELQLAYDPTTVDVLRKAYRKAMYSITLPGSVFPVGYATFFKGHDAFMPAHFMDMMYSLVEDGKAQLTTPITLRPASDPETYFEVAIKDIETYDFSEYEDERADICFARFPDVLPNAPDLTGNILDDPCYIGEKITGVLFVPDGKEQQIHTTTVFPISNLDYAGWTCANAFQYSIPTRKGDCGSLLGIAHPMTRGCKIIGIHTAGDGQKKGYAMRVTKDMIDKYYSIVDQPEVIDQQGFYEECVLTEDKIEPKGFRNLYKAPRNTVPMKTKLIKSPLWGQVCKSTCVPSKLMKFTNSKGDVIDPWVKARSNYLKNSYVMNIEVLERCAQSYINRCMKQSDDDAGWKPRVFTFEEAVAGIPGIPHCEGLSRSTSVGYPWVLNIPKGHKGKTHLFGQVGDYDFSSSYCKELKARVEDIIENAKNGVRLTHVYADFLKDEKRPFEKADLGKSRMVSGCPVDLLIVMRMYFMDFVRWFYTNRLRNGSAIGINPYSDEWHVLAKNLNGSPSKENLIAGDFSGYDTCITRLIQTMFLKFIGQWYNDDNNRIRAVLAEDMYNSKHITDGIVYEWLGSNPSGCFLTGTLNTVSNNVIIRYASVLSYCQMYNGDYRYPNIGVHTLENVMKLIEDHVYIIAFGDDNVISVGPACREWINQFSLTDAFKMFGFVYTMETKDGEAQKPFRNLSEINFLKRKWRFDGKLGKYLSPLDINTITEMFQWTKTDDIEFAFLRTTIEQALQELSAHGEETYNDLGFRLCAAARDKLDFIPNIVGYKHALQLQIGRDDYV